MNIITYTFIMHSHTHTQTYTLGTDVYVMMSFRLLAFTGLIQWACRVPPQVLFMALRPHHKVGRFDVVASRHGWNSPKGSDLVKRHQTSRGAKLVPRNIIITVATSCLSCLHLLTCLMYSWRQQNVSKSVLQVPLLVPPEQAIKTKNE